VGSPGFVQEISSQVDRFSVFFFLALFLFLFLCCSVPMCACRFSRVVVLDHHKTALKKLSLTATGESVTKVIDMERSGATIAFDYFKEKLKLDHKQTVVEVGEFDRLGPLFKYVKDGDLRKWRLPNSKAFNSGLKDSGIEFDMQLNPSSFQQVINLLNPLPASSDNSDSIL
jgi:oligoribonuclease NrnB/cAMP/cGMP phosphodiesterase (DHH superfamily)